MMHLKGGFAGPFFWLAGLPGDTLKSKWQTGKLPEVTSNKYAPYINLSNNFKDLDGKYKNLREVLMRTNTIEQLYKGFKPVMARDFQCSTFHFGYYTQYNVRSLAFQ